MLVLIFLAAYSSKFIFVTTEKREQFVLVVGMTSIFLVLALKRYTVGYDIQGYMIQYYKARGKIWGDTGFVYFEKGFTLLMQLFSKLGVSFQLFMAVVYGFFCFSVGRFIRKYSSDVMLSLLIFICYQFFVFSVSGIRQMIAMGICLLAYCTFEKGGWKNVLASFALVWLATTFHQSAIVFFAVLAIGLIKAEAINLVYYLIALGTTSLFRPYIWSAVEQYFGRDYGQSGSAVLGGNFVFLIGMCLFIYITGGLVRSVQHYRIKGLLVKNVKIQDMFLSRIMLVTLILYIVFSGSPMLRSTMYFTLFLIPGIPNTIQYYSFRWRTGMKFVVAIFLLWLFYTDVLVPGQLGITPYAFFWE